MRSHGLNMRPSPPRATWPAEDDIAADKAIKSPNIRIRPRIRHDIVSPTRLARDRRPWISLALFGVNPRGKEEMVLHHLHQQPAEVQANCFQNPWSYSFELGSSSVKHSRDNHTARQAITWAKNTKLNDKHLSLHALKDAKPKTGSAVKRGRIERGWQSNAKHTFHPTTRRPSHILLQNLHIIGAGIHFKASTVISSEKGVKCPNLGPGNILFPT